jgi:hypothetical protein
VPCGCCLIAGVGAFVPRLVLLFLWLFTDLVTRAFDGWVAPLVGLLLLPYTTLAFVALYSPPVGVTGFGWFIVILAFIVDLSHYVGGAYSRKRRWSY